jgi:hypothetical protein
MQTEIWTAALRVRADRNRNGAVGYPPSYLDSTCPNLILKFVDAMLRLRARNSIFIRFAVAMRIQWCIYKKKITSVHIMGPKKVRTSVRSGAVI